MLTFSNHQIWLPQFKNIRIQVPSDAYLMTTNGMEKAMTSCIQWLLLLKELYIESFDDWWEWWVITYESKQVVQELYQSFILKLLQTGLVIAHTF